ncbi:hypothetical protein EV424DRAFT_1551695 [Suillus variegatus]|nr:hypothetical protein EV424DRAFT_1551695 [Suillus variegatus]
MYNSKFGKKKLPTWKSTQLPYLLFMLIQCIMSCISNLFASQYSPASVNQRLLVGTLACVHRSDLLINKERLRSLFLGGLPELQEAGAVCYGVPYTLYRVLKDLPQEY